MKLKAKIICFIINLFLCVFFSFGQDIPLDLIDDNAENFYEIDAMINSILQSKSDIDTSEGGEVNKYTRWRWFWNKRMGDPIYLSKKGSFNDYIKAVIELSELAVCSTSPIESNWTLLGPISMPLQQMGRVDAVARDPNNTSIVYAGTPVSGLWRTWNINTTTPVWQNITDNLQLPGLGILDILIHPTNSNIMYIATGLGQTDIRGVGGYGLGVLKTNNALDNNPVWTATGLFFNPFIGEQIQVRKLLMHPTSYNIIYAITNKEVYKTINGCDNWNSLSLQSVANNSAINLIDIEFNPNNSNIIYVSGTQLWRYDATTWTNITNLLSSPTNINSILLSNSQSNIYAMYRSGTGNNRIDISTDGGYTWSLHIITPKRFTTAVFEVSSANSNIMYAEGANFGTDRVIYKSIDGGSTFTAVNSYWPTNLYYGISTHADIRAFELISASNDGLSDVLLVGTDGGVLFSNSAIINTTSSCISDATISSPPCPVVNWRDVTGIGLAITQFFGFDDSEIESNLIIGGTQDNGLFAYHNGQWVGHVIADGYECAIDKVNPSRAIGEINYPSLRMTSNYGQNWSGFTNPAFGNQNNPINQNYSPAWWQIMVRPIHFDQNNTLYLAYHDVFRREQNTWQPISDFTALNVPRCSKIEAMEISPLYPNVIYVGFAYQTWNQDMNTCTIDCSAHSSCAPQWCCNCSSMCAPSCLKKKIYKTTDGGITWVDITTNLAPVCWAGISDIVSDPNDYNKIWVSFNGIWYNNSINPPYNGANRVWYSADGGTTWSDYSNGLTSLPVNTIVYEKGSNAGLYVGTDVGVFYTNNKIYNTQGWVCFSDNLPVCIVTDLEINYATNTIRAATFGRGIWESHLACPSDIDITHTGTIQPDFYEAKNNIYSSATLQAGTTVYRAGNEIIFTDGFVASAYDGVDFHAFIHSCDAPGNSFKMMLSAAIDTTTVPEVDTLFIKEPITENKIISIFPNPSEGNFTLQTNTDMLVSFYIYNLMGHLIYKKENTYAQINNIDISNYSKGIYFIRIIAGNEVYYEKIIYQ